MPLDIVRGREQQIAAGIQQAHGDIANAQLAAILHTIGIQVVPHQIADAGQRLAKVVISTGVAGRNHDTGKGVNADAATQASQVQRALSVQHRLRFRQCIHAGAQISAAIQPIRVCAHDQVRGAAAVIRAGQRNGHVADARLTRIVHTVGIAVRIHAPGEAGRCQFAEVVIRANRIGIRRNDQAGDGLTVHGVAYRAAVWCAGGLPAIKPAGRLHLGQRK